MHLTNARSIEVPKQKYSQNAFVGRLGSFTSYRNFEPKESNTKTDAYVNDFLIYKGGEDPRLFTWFETVWCLVQKPDFTQVLVPITYMQAASIPIKSDQEYHGKNWMPACNSSNLWLIRSLDPLVVLIYRDGKFKTVHGPKDNKLIGQYRGGCARFKNNSETEIHGFGHRTISNDIHELFYFELNTDNGDLKIKELNELSKYNLMDPTCFDGKQLYISCSQSNWWNPQTIENKVYDVMW